jgi:hypothetical protein
MWMFNTATGNDDVTHCFFSYRSLEENALAQKLAYDCNIAWVA